MTADQRAPDPMETIAAERNANTFFALLRTGYPAPDALLAQIEAARLRSPEALRAYCRAIQKHLERAHA